LPENILDKFCEKIESKTEILIARSNNKVHPVVSMWKVSLFDSLEKELKQENRKIMTLVEKHNFNLVDFNYENIDPFFNINTIDDLKIAEKFDHLNA
jgi:Molybdopterin-guanine dinucleotide biosynthesis protein A